MVFLDRRIDVNNEKKKSANKFLSQEDIDDFEQESLIKEWLEKSKKSAGFDFKHITSKGTARNTLVRASVSLDQKISEDGPGTFADLIAGSDGRDLFEREDINYAGIIDENLFYLGLDEELSEWVLKTLKLSTTLNLKRSRYRKFPIDSEW